MKRIDSVELMNLPFGSKIRVIWHSSKHHAKNSEYIGIIFGEKVGYEDGLVDNTIALAESIYNNCCMVYLLEEDEEVDSTDELYVSICPCGRIHFIPAEEVKIAIYQNKEILINCFNCGSGTLIGANIEQDPSAPDKFNYKIYEFHLEDIDFELSEGNFKANESEKVLSRVFFNNGVEVYMNSGRVADRFTPLGDFEDTFSSISPDDTKDMTSKQIDEITEKLEHDCKTVNMKKLLNYLTDEEADALSEFVIGGLNWEGTKWENNALKEEDINKTWRD